MLEEQQTTEVRWQRWVRGLLLLTVALLFHLPFLQPVSRELSHKEHMLADVARQVLLHGDQSLDYGKFFLEGEDAAEDVEQRWKMVATSLHEQIRPLSGRFASDGIPRLLFLLFRDAHLGRYHREEARMSGYFQQDAGGNCEAQTKLIVSSFRASSFSLPAGKELGIEVFQDHVQAVVVDRKQRTVWNLLTGEEDLKPRSDVYRPVVLLSAYLRGLGLNPPIPERDLLLLRGPKPKGLHQGWGFFTTSTMRLPAAAARNTEGPVPERAELPLPVPRRQEPSSGGGREATWREEFLREHDPIQLFAMDRVDGAVGLVGSTLVFQTREQSERYLALGSQLERRRFLLDLAEARIREEFSHNFPELPPIHRLASWQEGALSGRLHRIRRIEQLVSLAEMTVDRGRSSTMVAGELELRIPELRRLEEGVRAFTLDIAQSPASFLRHISAMDRTRRLLVLSFLVPRSQTAQIKTIAHEVSDPAQVALIQGEQGPSLPKEAPLVFTDIELIGTPTLAFSSATNERSTGAEVSTVSPSIDDRNVKPELAVPLAMGAYLDLVLSGFFSGSIQDALPVLARWDEQVSGSLVRFALPDPRCMELLLQLQLTVLRPLSEAGKPIPTHLQAAARRLERGCKR